jgi:hypothetical protein
MLPTGGNKPVGSTAVGTVIGTLSDVEITVGTVAVTIGGVRDSGIVVGSSCAYGAGAAATRAARLARGRRRSIGTVGRVHAAEKECDGCVKRCYRRCSCCSPGTTESTSPALRTPSTLSLLQIAPSFLYKASFLLCTFVRVL